MTPSNIKEATSKLKDDGVVIILDDIASERQSYLVAQAKTANESRISWMINSGRGILFIALTEEEANNRGMKPAFIDPNSGFRFGPSIESREGVRSGISASDRATTVRSFFDASLSNKSIVSPGHVFPLISRKGGLLVSYGVPEGVSDLLRISGLKEIGILMHLLNEQGEHFTSDQLEEFSSLNNTPVVRLSDIAKYLISTEPLVKKEAETRIPTKDFGVLVAHGFKSLHDQVEHIAFTYNLELSNGNSVLTRMHSEKKVGDIFHIDPKGGRFKLRSALDEITKAGSGAFVYIRKSNAKTTSEELLDNSEQKVKIQDLRELGVGAQILQALNIKSIKLISSSSSRVPDLSAFNILLSV